jgi:hypothetical protein
MGWTVSKTSGHNLVDKDSYGFDIKGVVKMGNGGAAGIVTIFHLVLFRTSWSFWQSE